MLRWQKTETHSNLSAKDSNLLLGWVAKEYDDSGWLWCICGASGAHKAYSRAEAEECLLRALRAEAYARVLLFATVEGEW